MGLQEGQPTPLQFAVHSEGYTTYINQPTQESIHPEKNGFFHLNIECLQKHDWSIEMRMVTVTDEVFMWLMQQQLEYLNNEGILQHITTNKEKTL